MIQQGLHAMMATATHDEDAQMKFVTALKDHVTTRIGPGNRVVYNTVAEPTFRKQHGRAPKDRHEVHREMRRDARWQMFGSLSRLYQELKQDGGATIIDRQIGDLNDRARRYRDSNRKLGSLRLNPNLVIPRYQADVDIHCLPGGYHTDRSPDDVTAGAMYDPGVYYFAMGAMGPYNEDMGIAIPNWLAKTRPGFKPKRILDMGCTVGHCTIPYTEAYPDAEVHAIDLAAPVLRYAHARAEAMGAAVHFSQQNAESTDFPDGHFDLIVSHILLHETSFRAIYNIMKESYRLLSPGGIVAHADIPVRNAELHPFDAFTYDWATHYNAEPFWGTLHDMDLNKPALEAGFSPDGVILEYTDKHFGGGPGLTGGGRWLLYGGQK